MVYQSFSGDVLSGVCFVGLWDPVSLRYFVLTPLLIYLVLGFAFLVLGFTSLIRVRTFMKQEGTKTSELERLIKRIAVFALLYVLPSAALVACYFWEQAHLPDWTQMWQERICRDDAFKNKWQTPCRYPDGRQPDADEPNLTLFLVKYFSLLLAGIFSGCWLWGGITREESWLDFFKRTFCRKRPQEAHV